MITSQERIKAILNFQTPDRIAKADSFWEETVERWHREGLPENRSPGEHFGTDEISGIGVGLSGQLEFKVIEETERYVILINENGVTRKALKGEDGRWSQHKDYADLDFTVKDWKSWEAYKERLQPFESRLSPKVKQLYDEQRRKGKFIVYTGSDPYEKTQGVIGQVALLTKMVEDPDFVRDIFEAHVTLMIQMCQMLMDQEIIFNGAWFYGDIAYNKGLLFSPKAYREVLMPSHKRLFDFCNAHDMPVIYHTDGDVRGAIPFLIEAGICCLQPLEAKAGLDVRELKAEYGDRLAFMGNMDIQVMGSGDRRLIEEEVKRKLLVAKRGGGYIYHSDHSVPPSVSLESYEWVMELIDRYGRY
jgi:uroporphyrinogen decarboxylase